MKKQFIDKSADLIDRFIVIFYFAFLMLNVVQRVLNKMGGGVITLLVYYFFWFYFVLLYGENNGNKINKKPLVIFLIIFMTIVQLFWNDAAMYSSAFGPVKVYIFNMFSFIPVVFSTLAILEKSSEKTFKLIKYALILFLVTTAVFSIYHLIKDPTAGKSTATSHAKYYPFLMSYDSTYGLSLTFPCFVAWILTTKKKNKWWSILAIVSKIAFVGLIILAVWKMSFLLALITAIFSVIVFFVVRIKNKTFRYWLICGTVILILFLLATSWAADICYWLADIIDYDILSARIRGIGKFIETGVKGKGDSTNRLVMYRDGFLSFLKNPFTGNIIINPNASLSLHTAIIDILDGFGIFTAIFFLGTIVSVLRYHLKYKDRNKKAAGIASFVGLIFVMIVNPVFAAPEILMFYFIGCTAFLGHPTIGKKPLTINRCLYEDS